MHVKKPFLIYLIFGISVTILLIIVHHQHSRIQELKNAFPYLITGDTISYFDLIGMNKEKKVDIAMLEESDLSLILIFKQPCTRCNKNMRLWEAFTTILGRDVKIWGVIPGKYDEAFSFADEAKVNFKLYVPEDINRFKKRMKLKTNDAYTILCSKNRVEILKIGNLEADDFTGIVKKAKSIINNKGE